MCGRFSNAKELSELAQLVEFVCHVAFFAPRYNIAPRQQVPVRSMSAPNPPKSIPASATNSSTRGRKRC
jgi:putative SOS response-associated peptidase YedK